MTIDIVCALDPALRARELKRRLEPSNVLLVGDAEEIASALRAQSADMVIADTGVVTAPVETWVRGVRASPRGPEVVLVHEQEDAEFRAAALRAGCQAVLGAALPIEEMAETIQTLVERRRELVRLRHARTPVSDVRLRDLTPSSPAMRKLIDLALRVVDTDSSLLILGETGTGKERLARAIHQEGPRTGGPFVAVNCGALPESLIESELFGHEKGAFTGATHMRRGYFEQADGGTLFLDEIGEIPLPLQARLLRVLEDRRVQRVGAERSVEVDLRILAASNRDAESEVRAGRMREDLYYRLAVVTLDIPPLRERSEDVRALFEHYLEAFAAALNRPVFGVEPRALEALTRHSWPGNVRELINVAERAALLSKGPEIRLADLPAAIAAKASGAPSPTSSDSERREDGPPWVGLPFREARQRWVDDFERRYLERLLRETAGRVGEAAGRAGLNQRSLYELMRRHGLHKESFRRLPVRDR